MVNVVEFPFRTDKNDIFVRETLVCDVCNLIIGVINKNSVYVYSLEEYSHG
jgi:hypothetical protein